MLNTHTHKISKKAQLFVLTCSNTCCKYLCVCHFSTDKSTELGGMHRCCLPQAAPDAATTLRPDDSLPYLIFSNRFFFFWLMLPAHPHESRQTKRMPCELQACANGCSRGKLCPKRNVMWPGEHAQAARQPSFTAVV